MDGRRRRKNAKSHSLLIVSFRLLVIGIVIAVFKSVGFDEMRR